MTVVVVCPKCSKQLKVTEQQVGKRAKCPNCKEVITLQASAPAAGAASAEKGMWKVMTGENEEFGPVTKAELDAWMADGRLDAQCQVLQDGWEQWKWADEVYPQLAETNSAQTPTLQVATSPTVGLNTGGISLPPLGGPDSLPLPGTGGPKLPTPVGNPSPGPLGLGSPLGGAPLGSSPLVGSAPIMPGPGMPGPGMPGPGMPSPGMPGPMMPGPGGPMMPQIPYQSPMMGMGGPDHSIPPGAEVCQGAITALKNTQNWVLIFVVLSGLGVLFGGLGTLGYAGLMLLALGIRGLVAVFFGLIPVAVQALFAWLLFKYYTSIGEFVARPVQGNLQKALEAQQQFWMAAGIAVLVMIGLYVLMFLAMFLFLGGLAAAAGARF